MLVDAAIGATEGRLDLHLNLPNPTVATGSQAFIAAADGAPRWEGQRRTETVTVPVTTLDALIARHGLPAFVKIDVEGHLYVTGATGVWVFEPDGTLLGVVATPERPANCAWGDADRKSLYVTAQTSLYRIRTKVAGLPVV